MHHHVIRDSSSPADHCSPGPYHNHLLPTTLLDTQARLQLEPVSFHVLQHFLHQGVGWVVVTCHITPRLPQGCRVECCSFKDSRVTCQHIRGSSPAGSSLASAMFMIFTTPAMGNGADGLTAMSCSRRHHCRGRLRSACSGPVRIWRVDCRGVVVNPGKGWREAHPS